MNLGVFQVDLGLMMEFFNQDFFEILKDLMVIFGWVALEFAFLYMGVTFYRKYRKSKYTADWRWVLLAIDIPSLNVQTPMAVEQMFAHLAGAFEQPDIAATFRRGFDQRSFSFEIIGIEGYIQFLVKTEETFRDLVEAAIYAQYPEAEITEVEEYTDNFPDKFPDEEYDIWATDFGLIEDSAYPIRTYRDFEHSISKDTVLKDPMGAFLESFSRIGPGEHMWFQIIIEPISNDWKEDAIKKIKDIIGETKKTSGKKTISDYIGNAPVKILEGVGDQVFGREASPAAIESNGREEEQNKLKFLTPGQMKVVEAMEEKIAKIGFKTKMRGMYIAKKDVFKPERGVHALVGAIKQYNVPSANSILPTFGLKLSYFLKERRVAWRKNTLMWAYKKRKIKMGGNPCILNIEELATIWHFPMSHVKTPLVQKAESKLTEPPAGLPVEGIVEKLVEKKDKKAGHETDGGDVFKEGQKFG